jgi:hypothetical protein
MSTGQYKPVQMREVEEMILIHLSSDNGDQHPVSFPSVFPVPGSKHQPMGTFDSSCADQRKCTFFKKVKDVLKPNCAQVSY